MSRADMPPILRGCDVLPALRTSSPAPQRKVRASPLEKQRTAGRFQVLNTFIDFSMAGLRRTEIVVWFVLYRDTKPDGTARTSQADMARRAGVSERTVRRVIRRLERAGFLVVVYRGGLNRGMSAYRVLPLRPAAAPDTDLSA